jgi:glycosyltransferase involved in cell wall biosynthesis
VVVNPNESIPVRLSAPMLVCAQNLLFYCRDVGPLRAGPIAARAKSQLQFAFYRRQIPRVYSRAEGVVVVSRTAAETLHRHAGLDLGKVHIVPYGADRLPVRERMETAGRRRLVAIGAIAHYKRLNVLVDALARLGNGYELALAGEPWPGAGEAVDAQARALGIGERVRRLRGLSDNQLAELLASAHAAVSLSRCESFGIPLVEAMRAGVPVVVAKAPWSAEVLGDAAIHIDGDNAAAVAAGVLALEDPEEWQERADGGREVAKRYTWLGMAEGIAAAAAAVARKRA